MKRSLNYSRILFVVAILAIAVLAACAPAAQTGTYPPSAGAPAQAPTVMAADTPTSAPTTAPTSAPAAAPATVAINLAKNDALGSFLSDGQGKTLYLFLKDTPNTSNCYDACAQKWPALVSSDKPTLGDGVDASLVGSTQRKDGSMQVTYNGHPLYYYAPDQKPGDTNGQGVGSVWFVVTAAGDPFTGSAAPAAATTPSASNAPANNAVSLQLTSNDKLGKFIADGQGTTLYLFMKDTMNTSNCNDACAQKWPPLISQGKPTLGGGLDASLVGTTQRKDGSMQVTYNGHPLYHYAPDQKPGDVLGQGVGSVWFVVTAAGDPFTGSAAPAAAPVQAPTQAPSNPYRYP